MGATESIGGFFTTLELISNEKSFKRGISALKTVESGVRGLASFAVKSFSLAGGGILAMASMVAQADNRNMQLAHSLRMNVSNLMQWKGAANIAGISADGLTSSLLNLQQKADRLKIGEVDIGLAKSLGLMGLGYQNFLGMGTEDKIKSVLTRAMTMKDKGKAGELIRDVLGNAGKELFQYMQMTGQSIDSILAKSKALQFTNDKVRKGSMLFNSEVKSTWQTFKEMGSLFMGTFGIEFSPILQGFQKIIIANKQLIALNIVKAAKSVVSIAKTIFDTLKIGIPLVITLINKMGGLEGVITKVGLAFGIFYATKTITGIASLVKGIGALNMLKTGGITLGFMALFLIIEDIYSYMKGKKSITGEFVKWLDQVADKVQPLRDLIEAFNNLYGMISKNEKTERGKFFSDLEEMQLEAENKAKKEGKSGFGIWWAGYKAKVIMGLEDVAKKNPEKKEKVQGIINFLNNERLEDQGTKKESQGIIETAIGKKEENEKVKNILNKKTINEESSTIEKVNVIENINKKLEDFGNNINKFFNKFENKTNVEITVKNPENINEIKVNGRTIDKNASYINKGKRK